MIAPPETSRPSKSTPRFPLVGWTSFALATVFIGFAEPTRAKEVYHWDFAKGTRDLVSKVNSGLGNPAGRGPSGYSFEEGNGIAVYQPKHLAVRGTYTIILLFSLTTNDTGYQKLIDFGNFANDEGLYAYDNYFYFYEDGPDLDNFTFEPGQRIVLVIRRNDANNLVTATFNGKRLWSYVDSEKFGYFNGPNNVMRFFEDDGTEDPAGTVRKIRVFNNVLPELPALLSKSKKLKLALKKAQRSKDEKRIKRAKKKYMDNLALVKALRTP